MRSLHVPEHIVLRLTMENRDELLNILNRARECTPFMKELKKALFNGKDLELAENRALPND